MVSAIPFAYWQAASGGGGGGSAPTMVEMVPGTDSSGGSGNSITIGFTTNVAAGEYVILVVISGVVGGNTINTPTGFTKLYGDGVIYGVYAKKMVGNEGNLFTIDYVYAAGILVGIKVSGVGSTPLDVSAQATNTKTGSSVTTTAANDLIFSIWIAQNNATVSAAPSGYTLVTMSGGAQRQFVSSAHDGPVTIYIATTTQASAGASGTQVWTAAANADWIVTIAVKPT